MITIFDLDTKLQTDIELKNIVEVKFSTNKQFVTVQTNEYDNYYYHGEFISLQGDIDNFIGINDDGIQFYLNPLFIKYWEFIPETELVFVNYTSDNLLGVFSASPEILESLPKCLQIL